MKKDKPMMSVTSIIQGSQNQAWGHANGLKWNVPKIPTLPDHHKGFYSNLGPSDPSSHSPITNVTNIASAASALDDISYIFRYQGNEHSHNGKGIVHNYGLKGTK